MDCNPLFSYLKSIVKWMIKYFAKLFIINEIQINLGRIGNKCVFYSVLIKKIAEIEKKNK